MDYRERDFSNASFKNQNLTDADFTQATLINTDFSNAILVDANFSKANLSGANFESANLNDANFNSAIMEKANLKDAKIRGCDFSYAILLNADLTLAEMGKSLTKALSLIFKSLFFGVFWIFVNWGHGSGSHLDINKNYKSIGIQIVIGITSLIGMIIFTNSIVIAVKDNNIVREIMSCLVAFFCFVFSIFATKECISLVNMEIDTKFYEANLTNTIFDNNKVE